MEPRWDNTESRPVAIAAYLYLVAASMEPRWDNTESPVRAALGRGSFSLQWSRVGITRNHASFEAITTGAYGFNGAALG